MKSFTKVVGGLAAVLLMGPLVKDAVAVDLTGTWTGTANCAGVVKGVDKEVENIDLTILISQASKHLNLYITLATADLNYDLNGSHYYQGDLNKKNGDSGRAKITQCGTTFAHQSFDGVVGIIKAKTRETTGITILKRGELTSLNEPDSAVACVFDHVERTNTEDPSIGPCL